ncbi:sialidase-like [Rissa tridactyla]|uniref:sialidase-like n=1 Tax=Rissa tridactyla TaxID=75485 RepID=UPI0023BA6AB7|nr:sialidase-like [Rissa tridactyla]XP_054039119.1 sialidase-like [Rissa tridactyla]XP_054039120.1 sialidase-like [Rissa tridactyla]
MGAGGVVPPPCSFTPTQAPCHRQAPITQTESHRDTSAPTQACQLPTTPQHSMVGGQHGRSAHAAPSPSSHHRHGGKCTPEHNAVIGTCGHTRGRSSPVCCAGMAVGGGSAARLWEVSHRSGDQPGSHHTHGAHTCSSAHTYEDSTARISTRMPTRTLCTISWLAQSRAARGERSWPWGASSASPWTPLGPSTASTPSGSNPTWPPGSLGSVLHPPSPATSPPSPRAGAGMCVDGRWGGKAGGKPEGREGRGDNAGQVRATDSSPSNRQPRWPRRMVAWQRRLTWQHSLGQGSICSAGDVN